MQAAPRLKDARNLSAGEERLLHMADRVLKCSMEERKHEELGETIPLKAVDNPRWVWFYRRTQNRIPAVLIPSMLSYVFGTLHPTGFIKILLDSNSVLETLDHVVPGNLAMLVGSILFGLILFTLYELVAPPVNMKQTQSLAK